VKRYFLAQADSKNLMALPSRTERSNDTQVEEKLNPVGARDAPEGTSTPRILRHSEPRN